MRKSIYLKIITGIVVFVVLLLIVTKVVVEPWIGNKIEAKFNEKSKDYVIEINKVHISVFTSSFELDSITLHAKEESGVDRVLNGQIASIKLKGISFWKALFKKDIAINKVIISNTAIRGKIPFPEEDKPPMISSLNIRIDSIRFDNIEFAIQNTLNAAAYSVKEGALKISGFQVEKQDTLNVGIFKQINFNAKEFLSVSADSMYTYIASGIVCSEDLNTLNADSFSIHPNYKEHEFTSRHKYQTDRIEARLSSIFLHNFSAAGYLTSKKLVSSFVEIGKIEVNAFRDKRKKFHHLKKAAFQDMIYDYPAMINIDSIGLMSGNISYTEHAEKANEPGTVTFNELYAKIYKITNDTVYKTEKGYLKMKAEARLMGKARMTILLKGRLFDKHNSILLNGTLSDMEVKDLNPMLEKNAFIYATSGKIDKMNFSFTADNSRALGKMIFLYHGLDIAVKNKRTDDTTAIIERVTSIIANIKVIDSNPAPKEAVREGIIDYPRDPERFIFNYCAKSILSGIKSSLVKSPKK
ncbi:MAG TPA: hypothetical protein VFC67_16665 [Prolixibacteraceae bacterium]|nr:hypothetical protein [Prolixibacteraceae bacterium]